MGRVLMEEGEAREYSCVKEAQGWGNPAQVQRRAFEVRGWVRTFREQVTDAEWWGRSLDIKVDKLWSLTVRNSVYWQIDYMCAAVAQLLLLLLSRFSRV